MTKSRLCHYDPWPRFAQEEVEDESCLSAAQLLSQHRGDDGDDAYEDDYYEDDDYY